MLNEYTYCPRLAYLMWTQQEWADNVETLEGKHAHRRVDQPEGPRAQIHQRSVHLTSDRLGATAIIDLVEEEKGRVRPVDYKRGRKPADRPAYDPEQVQLCLQGLLLREAGHACDEGIIYYVASKQRVRIVFTEELVAKTLRLLGEMRQVLSNGTIPPPLEDSPKCPKCSLVQICMPEEVRFLLRGGKVRPLIASDPATHPLVVQEPRARVRLDHERLLVEGAEGLIGEARLEEMSQLVLMSGAQSTAAALQECCRRGIPIVHMSGAGWLYGITLGMVHKNVELRARQFAAAASTARSLPVARALVSAKIVNCRVLLRRNGQAEARALSQLKAYAGQAEQAGSLDELLGIEGTAARIYFAEFPSMLKGSAALAAAFRLEERNKRPPADPINALLSFAYSLLTKDWLTTLYSVGFDPFMGLYHQAKYGKPALALDLMEPFRPIVADSVAVGVLNNGEITESDFVEHAGGVLLAPGARRRLISAYERRLATEARHPLFGYACGYRRLFEIQARLLARYLLEEIPEYPKFEVR